GWSGEAGPEANGFLTGPAIRWERCTARSKEYGTPRLLDRSARDVPGHDSAPALPRDQDGATARGTSDPREPSCKRYRAEIGLSHGAELRPAYRVQGKARLPT